MNSITGKVISTKMSKTVVVSVEERWQHPLYKKTVKKTKKYIAHDESGAQMGQEVTLVPCRPISKMKRWQVLSSEKTTTKA